jgi:hypothetical protein
MRVLTREEKMEEEFDIDYGTRRKNNTLSVK